MTEQQQHQRAEQQAEAATARVVAALAAPAASTRLRAAMAAGSDPQPEYLEELVRRCAVEPDFYVRDMLTWAVTRADREAATALVLRELGSPIAQARSQALHTLSKLGDPASWTAVTEAQLRDADDEVARAAWRAATGLVPAGEETALAEVLATQLGRGDREVQLSLSRAFIALAESAAEVLERAERADDDRVAAHAIATRLLIENPDDGFDAAVDEARRTVALLAAPRV